MEIVKTVHLICAFLSISGFILRSYWMLIESDLFQHRLTKSLPHINDTLLLGAGLVMAFSWRISPLDQSWLGIKLLALLLYIFLGLFAFRFAKHKAQSTIACLTAIIVFGYIVLLANMKDPFLSLM